MSVGVERPSGECEHGQQINTMKYVQECAVFVPFSFLQINKNIFGMWRDTVSHDPSKFLKQAQLTGASSDRVCHIQQCGVDKVIFLGLEPQMF